MKTLMLLTLLGLLGCSDVHYLNKQERQQVEMLCQRVLREHLLDAKPEMLTAKEWQAVLAEYRSAEAADARDLASASPVIPDHVGDLIDRLARRLRR